MAAAQVAAALVAMASVEDLHEDIMRLPPARPWGGSDGGGFTWQLRGGASGDFEQVVA